MLLTFALTGCGDENFEISDIPPSKLHPVGDDTPLSDVTLLVMPPPPSFSAIPPSAIYPRSMMRP